MEGKLKVDWYFPPKFVTATLIVTFFLESPKTLKVLSRTVRKLFVSPGDDIMLMLLKGPFVAHVVEGPGSGAVAEFDFDEGFGREIPIANFQSLKS